MRPTRSVLELLVLVLGVASLAAGCGAPRRGGTVGSGTEGEGEGGAEGEGEGAAEGEGEGAAEGEGEGEGEGAAEGEGEGEGEGAAEGEGEGGCEEQVCRPGSMQLCRCEDNRRGSELCRDDGCGWSPCDCEGTAEGEGEGEGPAEGEGEGPAEGEGEGGGAGACDNDADIAIVAEPTLAEAVTGCAFQCLQAQPGDPCARDCIAGQTGLSQACSQCFADAAACVGASCIPACFTYESPECTECRAQSCDPAFFECSGLRQP